MAKSGWLVFFMSLQQAQLLPAPPRSAFRAGIAAEEEEGDSPAPGAGAGGTRALGSETEGFWLCRVGIRSLQSARSALCFPPEVPADLEAGAPREAGWMAVPQRGGRMLCEVRRSEDRRCRGGEKDIYIFHLAE